MLRVAAIVLCSVIFPVKTFAWLRLSMTAPASFAIAVDDDGVFVWKPTEQDCHEWPHWAPTEGCAIYQHLAAAPAPGDQAPPPGRPLNGIAPVQPKSQAAQPRHQPVINLSWPKPLTPQKKVAALVRQDLEGKGAGKVLGQLLISGFEGKTAAASGVREVSDALRKGMLAGILVRGVNISSRRQLTALLSYMRDQDASAFIVIEQPGGPDAILSEERGFAAYGAAGAVGSAMPPYQAQLLYRDMAAELSSAGINFNIGPSGDVCADSGVDLSADCFGTNLSSVNAFGRAFTFGHHDRHVLTALRHSLRRVSSAKESPSFAILHGVIKSEISDAIVVRMKTSDLLRLTKPHLGGVALRDRVQNCGPRDVLVVEWDIETYGVPVRHRDAIVRAFQAGTDMIVVREPSGLPGNLLDLSFETIKKGLETGALPPSNIKAAYERVQRLKQQLRTKISEVVP